MEVEVKDIVPEIYQLPHEIREHVLSYLGCLDYLNMHRALDDLFNNWHPQRVFNLRAEYYTNLLTIVRKLLAKTWMEIMDGHMDVKHGQIWILDPTLYDKFYTLLLRMKAALNYSRGLRIEMMIDQCGELRYGDPQYWRDNQQTMIHSSLRLKGRPANMILRNARDPVADRIIVANLISIGYEARESLWNKDQGIADILTGPCSRKNLAKLRISQPNTNILIFACCSTNAKDFNADSGLVADPANQSILTFGICKPAQVVQEILTTHQHQQDNQYQYITSSFDFRLPESSMTEQKVVLRLIQENNPQDEQLLQAEY